MLFKKAMPTSILTNFFVAKTVKYPLLLATTNGRNICLIKLTALIAAASTAAAAPAGWLHS